MLAVSNFGVYGCIASFILHGPILYTTYLGGSPQAIGTIGVIMGFFNAVNGLPIAHLADKGYLNKFDGYGYFKSSLISKKIIKWN